MDGQTEGGMKFPPCVLQDFGPLGPLPFFPSLQFTITQSRATSIADLFFFFVYFFLFLAFLVTAFAVRETLQHPPHSYITRFQLWSPEAN